MVATVSTKKCPPNIRTGTLHPPMLVSPISVAQRNKMLESEGTKKGANWMREQWVANLKKKNGPMNTGTESDINSPVPTPSTSTTNTPVKAKGNGRQRSINKSTPSINPTSGVGDKDNLGLLHPAMFFNDLGCFELESPSFTRLTPSQQEEAMVQPILSTSAPSSSKGGNKKWGKPLMKKRGNMAHLDPNAPKPRTPARKLNNGNRFFDDIDPTLASSSLPASLYSFSSVGTPSNFNHTEGSTRMLWGPELDFTVGYDTFLDLPTPKCAEMPATYHSNNTMHHGVHPSQTQLDRELEKPQLIRTTSIEQEGLSHVFEQTAFLGNDSGGEEEMMQYPTNHTAYQSTPSRRGSIHTQYMHAAQHNATAAAAAGVVEEYYKMLPASAYQLHPHHQQRMMAGRKQRTTPRTVNGYPHHSHKNMPEFETLLDEYKFEEDMDHELDTIYLDTMETFHGELDLITN